MSVAKAKKELEELEIEPNENFVMILQDAAQDETDGGIQLPESAKQAAPLGTIVKVGPGLRNQNGERVPMWLNVGDRVYWTQKSPTKMQFKESGLEYVLLRENNILIKKSKA